MSKLGQLFLEKRTKKGITLEEAADDLHLRQKYLVALEEDDFERLPAAVYTIGFIRNYARYLELDEEMLVSKYKTILSPDENGIEEPEPASYSLLWVGVISLAVIALVIIGIRISFHRPDSAGPPVSRREPVIEPEVPAGPPAESEEDSEVETEDGREQETENSLERRLEVDVVAVEETWLYVIFDGLGKREMLLQPGESVSWEAEETIRIRLGNAAGIRLYYDGVELPPLGRSGEVLDKIITLQNAELQIREVGSGGN